MKEGGLFWLQQPNTGMKLKKIIKEIENNDESTITVDKASYIALLREVNRLRFKCSQRGALSRKKWPVWITVTSLRRCWDEA